jgi:hypothetical protein
VDEYEAEFERLLKREPPPTAGDIEVMARKWGGKPPKPERVAAFRALAEGSKLEGAAAALDRAFAEPKARGGRKKKDKPVPGAKDEAGFLLRQRHYRPNHRAAFSRCPTLRPSFTSHDPHPSVSVAPPVSPERLSPPGHGRRCNVDW